MAHRKALSSKESFQKMAPGVKPESNRRGGSASGLRSAANSRPMSIRLTFDERAQLEREAGAVPLSDYVRARLFEGRKRSRATLSQPDRRALAQLLGKLGALRVAYDLTTLSAAAKSGSLPVAPETESALRRAAGDVTEMKALLMKALNIAEG